MRKELALLIMILLFGVKMIFAESIKLDRVQRVIDLKPSSGHYVRLNLNDPPKSGSEEDSSSQVSQNERVIVETTTSIVEDEACECPVVIPAAGGFPWWTLLGLGAVPFVPIAFNNEETTIPTSTETPTPTAIPTVTPAPTVPPTVTPTKTPTPKEPIPEPVTILLFGTSLAGIGLIARRKFSKSKEERR